MDFYTLSAALKVRVIKRLCQSIITEGENERAGAFQSNTKMLKITVTSDNYLYARSKLPWGLIILITAIEKFKTQPKVLLYYNHLLNITKDWQYVTANCTQHTNHLGFPYLSSHFRFPTHFQATMLSLGQYISTQYFSLYELSYLIPTIYRSLYRSIALSHTCTHVRTRYKCIKYNTLCTHVPGRHKTMERNTHTHTRTRGWMNARTKRINTKKTTRLIQPWHS